MKKTGFKHTTEKEYNNVKLLQRAGLKSTMVAQVTGRSTGTIWAMFKAETYEAYKQSTKPTPKQPEPEVVNDGLLKLIHDKLSSIDTRLKFIEENIEIKPKRKFF